ncbi:15722_t:CDS:1, partial [Racocetra persica]
IAEPDRYNKSLISINKQNNIVVKKLLSFGEKITLMTKVLYEKQRKENNILELNPDQFQKMLEDAKPQLVGFFNELYDAFISKRRSSYNRKEDKKKVVNIYYSIAMIRNRLVNDYPLEIGLYLVASGAFCDAIDAMHKADIIVCYKTVKNYRKKVVAAHPENI